MLGTERPNTTGYRKNQSLANTVLNIVGATLLIVATLPFFVIIPIAIKLTDGGPIIYRSRRLGLRKQPYTMYKFRSLRVDAEAVLGSELVGPQHQVETDVGRFLRDTRLDELPQLINVLRGEMDLIGPRPERPEVYERYCRKIKGYDLRFDVRPGVVGYAQVFTPHSTPKRLRSLVDTHFVLREHTLRRDLSLLGHALWALAKRMVRASRDTAIAAARYRLWARVAEERRRLRRIALTNAIIYASPTGPCAPDQTKRCRVLDIHEEAVLVECNDPLPWACVSLSLQRPAANAWHRPPKPRTVRCLGDVIMTRADPRQGADAIQHVIQIEPISPLNAFKLEKYFLSLSVS
jgi:lipopolysaccharide/colanic/teichoic acid biosynthesis glycosyltransferase